MEIWYYIWNVNNPTQRNNFYLKSCAYIVKKYMSLTLCTKMNIKNSC